MTSASKFLLEGRVTGDHQFLPLVDPHLLPRARPQSRLVLAVLPFRHQSFEPLRLYGLDQVCKAGLKSRRVTDRFGQLRQHFLLQQIAPLGQRLGHYVLAGKHHDVEDVIDEVSLRGAVVLQRVERRLSRFVDRDDFAVDGRVVRKRGQRLRYRWVPQSEVIVVAGAEGELSTRFEGKGTVAVQLNFVAPLRTFRQHLRGKQQHGLDKPGLYLGGQICLL